MLESFRTDREAYKSEWAASLDHSSAEAAAKHQERLQASSDSWVVSSVRRLNEHGQSAVESLISLGGQLLARFLLEGLRRVGANVAPDKIDCGCSRVRSTAGLGIRGVASTLGVRRLGSPVAGRSHSHPELVRLLLSHYFANRTRDVFNLFLR